MKPIIIIIINYLIISFIALELNPAAWTVIHRIAFVIMTIIVLIDRKTKVYAVQAPTGEIIKIFRNKKDVEIFTSQTKELIITQREIE